MFLPGKEAPLTTINRGAFKTFLTAAHLRRAVYEKKGEQETGEIKTTG